MSLSAKSRDASSRPPKGIGEPALMARSFAGHSKRRDSSAVFTRLGAIALRGIPAPPPLLLSCRATYRTYEAPLMRTR